MTIHIYYRHTPVQRSSGKSRPDWFTHEKCFINFLETVKGKIKNGQVHINLVFDGAAADLEADFAIHHLTSLTERDSTLHRVVHTHRINGGNQRKAWRAAVALVKSHCDDGTIKKEDLIYLLENDYVHSSGWIDEVLDLARLNIRWDYLTLYDHPDKYPGLSSHRDSQHYRRLRSQLFATQRRHWRTTPSTCASYMLSRETFLRDHALLRLGIFDFRLFSILTKVLRRRLLSPIPALSTHSMSEFLSPGIDWSKEISRPHEQINLS